MCFGATSDQEWRIACANAQYCRVNKKSISIYTTLRTVGEYTVLRLFIIPFVFEISLFVRPIKVCSHLSQKLQTRASWNLVSSLMRACYIE